MLVLGQFLEGLHTIRQILVIQLNTCMQTHHTLLFLSYSDVTMSKEWGGGGGGRKGKVKEEWLSLPLFACFFFNKKITAVQLNKNT